MLTRQKVLGGLAVAALMTAGAWAQNANRMSGSDTFVTKAAQGGMAEVKLGELATKNASNQSVKQFGQRMVDDHSKANDQLKSIASKKSITLPSDVSAKQQADYDKLSKLNGAAFDRAYMMMMVKDHKEDVAEFEKASRMETDPDVKSFASSTLPTLQEHLKMAEDTDAQVKKSK